VTLHLPLQQQRQVPRPLLVRQGRWPRRRIRRHAAGRLRRLRLLPLLLPLLLRVVLLPVL